MIEYQIVRAGAADWQRLRSIRLRCLQESPDAFGSTYREEQRLASIEWQTRAENALVGQFLATSSDAKELGIAVGAPYAGRERTAGLFSMWVAPDARQLGIGTALVHAVIAWAQDENYRQIILDVGSSNIQAVRLYESCGFVSTGKVGTLAPPRQHILEKQMARILE